MHDEDDLGRTPFELEALEEELDRARDEAARAVDRAAALAALRSHAFEVFDELRRPLYASDVLLPRDPADEKERAYLSGLLLRINNGSED